MLYRVATISPPDDRPISVDEMKIHARLMFPGENDPFGGAEDDLIGGYIDAAVDELDFPMGHLGRSLMPRTVRLIIDSYPSEIITIPGPPVQSIESVDYIDKSGGTQTILPDDYDTDLADTGWPAAIWHKDKWPQMDDVPGRMTIEYIAGYDVPSLIPSVIRNAILVMAASKYRDRESSIVGTTISNHEHIARSLDNYRVKNAWGKLG